MPLIKHGGAIPASGITDRGLYLSRRDFIRTTAAVLAAGAGPLGAEPAHAQPPAPHGRRFERVAPSALSTAERPNPWEHVTTYNNFWEFGQGKGDPALQARTLKATPWSVVVSGECANPATYNVEDILRGETLEERIYRHRCVEGWSMVIPWVGFPLGHFIKRCEPTSKANFIEFTTLADSRQMPGIREPTLRWPYTEALRLDEALHPLTILAVGLYGEVLPNQNGAPIRLVIPWKYGFKSIKSIVRVRFVDKQPTTTWHDANPQLYGFWANVNPNIYPQASERRIGEFFKRRTLMFNGYADQVAGLYAGMDLRRFY
jgi:methionine sulfoxide reductase catalytic subunit